MSATAIATTTTTTTLTAHQCLPIQATTMGWHLLLPAQPAILLAYTQRVQQPPPHCAATTSSTCAATTHHHVWLRTLFVRSAKCCRKIKIQRPFYLTHLGPIWRQRTKRARKRRSYKRRGEKIRQNNDVIALHNQNRRRLRLGLGIRLRHKGCSGLAKIKVRALK